jgi:cellulose synthase/poly-beta-1,6-N-acetylglucosamine synthase-like glycosyltransferase
MMALLFGVVFLLIGLALLGDMVSSGKEVQWLVDVEPSSGKLPRLSVIIPARNEEAGVRAAVESVLRQDYPDLELIVLDDRSTDRTGAILAELAAEHPGRIQALTVRELPPGWLGKNHALWVGAQRATGEWLLFVDADVVFDPTCFRRAVTLAEAQGLDHVTMLPDMHSRSYLLGAFISYFGYSFVVSVRPHRATDPRWRQGVGVGAFNLVRRRAYEAIGTHRALTLRPDDDLRLGMRIKRAGLRQRCISGTRLAHIEWYPSMRAAIHGLEKNTFAVLEYRPALVGLGVAVLLLFGLGPYVSIWFMEGLARWVLAAAIAVYWAGFLYANRMWGRRALHYLPILPLLPSLFAFITLRSTVLTLWRGGISWRETFYPLKQLRGQTGLEGLD